MKSKKEEPITIVSIKFKVPNDKFENFALLLGKIKKLLEK